MIVNEIDKFRNEFFAKVIEEERKKQKDLERQQKSCHHNYSILGAMSVDGYQVRTCSKCEHTAIKSFRSWEASKRGDCTIA
jgi:hypothetical protein